MADNILESNVVLRTQVTGPTGTGFANLGRNLKALEDRLAGITNKEYKIVFTVDDSGLSHAKLKIVTEKTKQQIAKDIKEGVQQGISEGQAVASKRDIKVKVTVKETEEGTSVTTKRTQETTQGGKRVVTTQSGNVETRETTTLLEEERARRQRRRGVEGARRQLDQEEGHVDVPEAILEFDRERERRRRKALRDQAKQQLDRESGVVPPDPGESPEDRSIRIARERFARQFRRHERGQAVTAAEREQGARDAHEAMEELRGRGFRESKRSMTFNPKTGMSDEVVEFSHVARKGLGEYEMTIARVNRATGHLRVETLDAAQSARRMGDSFGKAVEKVGLWLGATSVIFATVRGLQDAVRVTLELEEATTLLARVSKNFGGNFKERLVGAREVQQQAVRFATLTGGDPEEAMKAAAVFARAGQNVQQTIESVRASMLAARIAEISVLEAAELLSAAYLQFGMNANQVMQILNQLNALSNNYRVTTDDLLQSISRAGSVIAQQNGRLTELAAVTAITSQVTARSGAEIGNAMKTIASNLERVETKDLLFERLAYSSVDAEGNTKSYTRALLEMQVTLNRASEAERNQIGISIAGVRQRNILLAQLKNVVEMIKAENLAIRQGQGNTGAGSAFEELRDTAGTLTAYLQRLRAEALKLTTEGGGPLMETAKDIVSVLTLMLQILSSGNGVIGRFAVFAAGIYVAIRALQALRANVSGATIAALQAALAHYQMGNAILKAGGDAAAANAQFALMRTSLASAAISAGVMSLAMVGLFIVVHQVIGALRHYQESQERLIAESKTADDQVQRQINRELERQKMFRETAMTVAFLADEIKRLNAEQEKKPSAQRGDQIKEYKQQIQELLDSAGINGQGVGPEAAIDKVIKTYQEETQKLMEARRQRIKILRGEKSDAGRDLGNMEEDFIHSTRNTFGFSRSTGISLNPFHEDRSQLAKEVAGLGLAGDITEPARRKMFRDFMENYKKAQQGDVAAIAERKRQEEDFGTRGMLGFTNSMYGELVRMAEEYTKSGKSVEEFTQEIEKEQKALDELTGSLGAAINRQRELRELMGLAKGVFEREDKKKITDEGTAAIRQMFGETTDFAMVKRETKEISDEVNRLMALIDKFPNSATKAVQKALIDDQKLLREKRNLLAQIAGASMQRQIAGDIEGVGRMSEAALMGRFGVQMAREHEPGLSSGYVETVARQRTSMARVEQLKKAFQSTGDIDRISKQVAGSEVSAFPEPDQSPGSTARNREAMLQQGIEQRELAKGIQQELVRMADLEVQKASQLLNLESQIAIERRKSADEAARALGVLSNTDKMRAFAQAAYLVKNPGKTFSFEEQFRMRSEDVSLGRQFFGGRYEDRLDPKRSPLARAFEDAGIGGSYELNRAAARAKEFRRGRTDEEVINDARNRAGRYRAEAEKLGGGVGVKPSYQLGAGYDEEGRARQPKLNVSAEINFRPMVEEFTNILRAEGEAIIKEARGIFEEDYRRFRNFRDTVPASSTSTP